MRGKQDAFKKIWVKHIINYCSMGIKMKMWGFLGYRHIPMLKRDKGMHSGSHLGSCGSKDEE